MFYDPPKRTVILKPGRTIPFQSGEALTIILQSPRCIVDVHSHIENGACAPLPLLWYQTPLQLHLRRRMLKVFSKVLKRAAGRMQVKSTTEIGNRAVREIDAAFGPKSEIGRSDLYKNCDLFTFLVIQMMDMEYAGIMGFKGQTIYHEDKTPWYYWERKNGKDPENKGKIVSLPGENQKTFSKWFNQLKDTKAAIKCRV